MRGIFSHIRIFNTKYIEKQDISTVIDKVM